MRRRLSIAIALVAEPKIVFLDEPSTGLDPENRRNLWEILAECKNKRAMVLTTHSVKKNKKTNKETNYSSNKFLFSFYKKKIFF
jgi:ABC-type multidrug transport system ATPase subunit